MYKNIIATLHENLRVILAVRDNFDYATFSGIDLKDDLFIESWSKPRPILDLHYLKTRYCYMWSWESTVVTAQIHEYGVRSS